MPKIILKINTPSDIVYDHPDICCYLLDAGLGTDYLQGFDARGRLCLVCGTDAPLFCKSLKADGVVFEPDVSQPMKKQISAIRGQIGTDKVLGIIIPPRRHEAMLASETEPAFVAFKFSPGDADAVSEVLAWYNDLFLIQSALDLSGGLEDASRLDADFEIINSCDYADFGC